MIYNPFPAGKTVFTNISGNKDDIVFVMATKSLRIGIGYDNVVVYKNLQPVKIYMLMTKFCRQHMIIKM